VDHLDGIIVRREGDGASDADADLTSPLVVALGRAATRVLGVQEFLVGRDTRASGPRIEADLTRGFTAEGARVTSLGVAPTPAVAFLAQRRGVPAAIVSASHNPWTDNGVKVTAILSARSPDLVMADDLFSKVGEVIRVLDTDGTSAVENVQDILERLIAKKRADAFFTCGSNRLMFLMKDLGKKHGIPGEVAMEQIMACGIGPCYVCVRTFEVNGHKELRRVCIEGPVFDLQECVGW